ncbi:unnamed protein product [Amoebophrya sp. A25]|nr:unnamed protein product [Amoebophrya sp. A25]|eukprot:GSA25T00026969001.1
MGVGPSKLWRVLTLAEMLSSVRFVSYAVDQRERRALRGRPNSSAFLALRSDLGPRNGAGGLLFKNAAFQGALTQFVAAMVRGHKSAPRVCVTKYDLRKPGSTVYSAGPFFDPAFYVVRGLIGRHTSEATDLWCGSPDLESKWIAIWHEKKVHYSHSLRGWFLSGPKVETGVRREWVMSKDLVEEAGGDFKLVEQRIESESKGGPRSWVEVSVKTSEPHGKESPKLALSVVGITA